MKTTTLFLVSLFLTSMTGFCNTVTITSTVNDTFSPNAITISSGDIVHFSLASIHDALEVSQSTWSADGSTALPGGFHVPFGGTPQDVTGLSVGTHYYICEAHISMGMKGTITVTALGVNDYQFVKSYQVFPNPTNSFVNVKANDSSLNLIYRIVDIYGNQVQAGNLNDVSASIDFTQFSSGIYFLQLGDDKRQNFKVVKR